MPNTGSSSSDKEKKEEWKRAVKHDDRDKLSELTKDILPTMPIVYIHTYPSSLLKKVTKPFLLRDPFKSGFTKELFFLNTSFRKVLSLLSALQNRSTPSPTPLAILREPHPSFLLNLRNAYMAEMIDLFANHSGKDELHIVVGASHVNPIIDFLKDKQFRKETIELYKEVTPLSYQALQDIKEAIKKKDFDTIRSIAEWAQVKEQYEL